MSLTNSFWSVLDWFFPAIRLPDDHRLDDLEALAERPYGLHTRTLSTSSRSQQQPRRPQPPEAEWRSSRQREQRKDGEREREREEILRLRRENEELKKRVSDLEASLKDAQVTISQAARAPPPSPDPQLRQSYDSLRSLHASVQQSLRERTEEVSSLRAFLTKTDDLSGAQLVQATYDLNSEIIQLSASIVDRFGLSFTKRFDTARQSDRNMLHPALGVRTVQLLEELHHSEDPIFVQYAIQAWEVAFVGKIVSAFCFGAPSETQQILSILFRRIQAAEPQATASRWRALTHSHLKAYLLASSSGTNRHVHPPTPVTPETPTSPALPVAPTKSSGTKLVESYIIDNIRGIIAIMALAGSEDRRSVHTTPMLEAFGSKLASIIDRASKLATVFREHVMSSTFEVVVIQPTGVPLNPSTPKQGSLSLSIPGATAFDHKTMESVFEEPGEEHDRGNVLCTIELGLAFVKKVEVANEPLAPSPGESRSRSEERQTGNSEAPNGIQRATSSNASIDTPRSTLNRNLLIKPKVMVDSSTLAFVQA